MSWRDDHQRARACHALLGLVGKGDLWTPMGPTPTAIEYWRADGGPLSSGERVVFLLAWAAWNGGGGLPVDALLASLSPRILVAVGHLLVAYAQGADAIDEWIEGVRG